MKKIFYIMLCISLILCAGCSSAKAEQSPGYYKLPSFRPAYRLIEDPCDPYELFHNNLMSDDDNLCIYPDSFGGVYMEYDENGGEIFTFVIAGDDYSDYQYLQDAFPNTKFLTGEYSYNYLCKVAQEYYAAAKSNSERIMSIGIDVISNRVVVEVDSETLSTKHPDEYSPIVYKLGTQIKAIMAL